MKTSSDGPIISLRGVSHFYGAGALRKQVLHEISADIRAGDVVVITGPSGSGKTTLLTLAGALRSVQQGSLQVLGEELYDAKPDTMLRIRGGIGYIFQSYNLLQSLTACQNVQMSLGPRPLSSPQSKQSALALLRAVGLEGYEHRYPRQLSSGQAGRVAIARALVRQPRIVLADEPTAALDRRSGHEVVEILRSLARKQGCAILIVTHDNRILDVADRVMHLEDGRLTSSEAAPSRDAVHLLRALKVMPDTHHLVAVFRRLSEADFLDLLGRISAESEQFLNVLEMGDRGATKVLFRALMEAVLSRVMEYLEAESATVMVPDGSQNAMRTRLALGAQAVANKNADTLLLQLRDRRERLAGLVQFGNKKTGVPFGPQDERTLRDFARPLGLLLEVSAHLESGSAASETVDSPSHQLDAELLGPKSSYSGVE